MKPFAIDLFQTVKGRTVNIRSENHGSEHVICMDWGVTIEVPNDWLDKLDPALKPMFYKAVPAGDEESAQAALEGVESVSAMPLLRTTNVKFPMALTHEFVGYQLTVDHGLGGKSDLVLREVKVNKFAIDCKEGGTVLVSFRIQAQRVSETERGCLSSFIKGAETKIALKAPQERQEPIDGTKGHPGATVHPMKGRKVSGAPDETVPDAADILAANETAGLNKTGAKPPRKGDPTAE